MRLNDPSPLPDPSWIGDDHLDYLEDDDDDTQ